MTEVTQLQANSQSPIIWTIAGSDSGGGAGIQADFATIQDLKSHPCTVITAITAQSSIGVDLVEAVSATMLQQQLDTLQADLAPSAIKIGLLVEQWQINLIATFLTQVDVQRKNIAVVLDPVMVASCGDNLAKVKQLDFSPLKGLLTVITPNEHELTKLTCIGSATISTNDECLVRARQLATELNCSVLAKGGDKDIASHTAVDVLVCRNVSACSKEHRNAEFELIGERIKTKNNHGTGCTLSSAIACFMAHEHPLQDAIVLAKAYVTNGLRFSYQLGMGPGVLARTSWPTDLSDFPEIAMISTAINCNRKSRISFPRLTKEIGIYPVVSDVELLAGLLQTGCSTIQLRIKEQQVAAYGQIWLEQQIEQAVMLGRRHCAQLFINDHWQLALKYSAFGIHLGQEDVLKADLAKISDAGIALGLSSHGCFEALIAHQIKPSYLALGHIYPTTTKVMPSKPQGLDKLKHYSELFKGQCPLVAIGGIGFEQLAAIKATKVDSAAVVRAITEAPDPLASFNKLSQQWHQRQWSDESHLGLSDVEFIRFSRQILLPEFGEQGQQKLKLAHAVIIGVGGLGTLVSHYLAASGIGKITLIDGDDICSSNLPRQLLFEPADIGKNKALVAASRLTEKYPNCQIVAINKMFPIADTSVFSDDAIVFDCTDNFTTRHQINSFCVTEQIRYISAAVASFTGLVFAYKPSHSGCYNCLFPEQMNVSDTCRTVGVLGPMVGVIASMQALLGIKLLTNIDNENGRLWSFDGKSFNWQSATLTKDSTCHICNEAKECSETGKKEEVA
ncbi:MAG: ThiF family adenylyltransferase [Parashewanella sp.]